MKKERVGLVWLLFFVSFSWAQNATVSNENSLVKNVAFQSVGPTIMSG
jgi:hypothetical protein